MSQQQPNDVVAEMSVLGAIFLDNDSFYKISLIINDFYFAKHREIFKAISDLIVAGGGADIITVRAKLLDSGSLDRCGGATYLAELENYTPTAANIKFYAGIVATKSIKRQVIAAAQESIQEAEREDNPDVLISNSLGRYQSIGHASEKVWNDNDDQEAEFLNYIKSADKNCFFTGYMPLDANLGDGKGVGPGEVMVLAGYSGTYKSGFAQNILLNFCMKTKKKVLLNSMEMSIATVYRRTIQIVLEQPTFYIDSGYAGKKPGYIEETKKELKRLGADNLIVSPLPGLTIEQIEHYARLARAKFGDIGVVAIDYLGLMAAEGTKSEYERVSYCAEQAKNMAKRLNLPVILLVQTNRTSAKDGEMETWSAKGSGAVEASADYMLGLQRLENKDIIIKLMKNRNGEANIKFKADLESKYLKFRSLEPFDEFSQKNTKRGLDRLKYGNQQPVPEFCPF